MENLVIIDLGSNSLRLSISEVYPDGTIKEVQRRKIQSRLAEGMGQDSEEKILRPAAIKRTLAALSEFKAEYEQYENIQLKGIATAAVRTAKNSNDFLRAVKELIGIEIEVLSGDSEAYYDYLGVVNLLGTQDCLIIDMGGGSFELILVRDGRAKNLVSIPYGAVSLSEKFKAQDQITAGDLFRMQRFIQVQFDSLPWLREGYGLPLVLLGGANRTVARYELCKRNAKKLTDLHGLTLKGSEFADIYGEWLAMTCQERQQVLKEEADRADIIIGGLTPVVQLVQTLALPEIVFSESGVREGVIFEMLKTAGLSPVAFSR